MKRAGLVILALMVVASTGGVALAQISTVTPPPMCGTIWIPCGTLPFATLNLPSPTLMATLPRPTAIPITATSSLAPTSTLQFSNTPGHTPTPSLWPTATTLINTGPISTIAGNIGSFSSTLQSQPTFNMVVGGTPMSRDEGAVAIGSNIGQLFGLARGMELTDMNKAGGIISFFLLSIGFALTVQLSMMFLPILWKMLQLVTQVIGSIVDLF